MKYTLYINQKQSIELGFKSVSQAIIFDLLTTASVWAEPIKVRGKVYYWVARQVVCAELPLLNLKPDTVYRHLKALDEIGVISYKKDGKKDLIQITPKGQKYVSDTISEINPNNDKKHYIGNKSELDKNSEINPSKFGNKSEKDSEINPTYQSTNTNQSTNDQEALFESFWSAGMVKQGKSKALARFMSIANKLKDQTLEEFTAMLVADIQARLNSNQLGFDKMHPTTYLNGERWEDEIKQGFSNDPKPDAFTRHQDRSWAAGIVPHETSEVIEHASNN